MSLLSTSVTRIKPSPTAAIHNLVTNLKLAGHNIINLGVGEPDFNTIDSAKKAGIAAIEANDTKYTPVDGSNLLKQAIINKFQRENNLNYRANQIIVGNGAKQVIYNALMATLNPLDELIILAPYWVSYIDMVLFAGGKPVIVETKAEDNFKVLASDLEKNISDKTKWLILNSPNNPTGIYYTRKNLESIAEVLIKYPHVNILSDDIYEHLIFDSLKFETIAEIAPQLKARTLVVNGVSKAHAMTGWRIGYGAGDEKLINAMSIIQSQSTSCVSSISQAAAAAALNGNQNHLKLNAKILQSRRDLMINILNEVDGISCNIPNGAFYIFANCQSIFGKKAPNGEVITNSSNLAAYLLKEALVATVPGIAFGTEGFIRITYCLPKDKLEDAGLKIKKVCARLT